MIHFTSLVVIFEEMQIPFNPQATVTAFESPHNQQYSLLTEYTNITNVLTTRCKLILFGQRHWF